MRHGAIPAIAPTLALVCALVAGMPDAVAATPDGRYDGRAALETQNTQNTMKGTVQSMDAEAGTVKVITGVGLALWAVEVRVYDETRITVAGQAASLADLERGQVVEIEYRDTPEGRVAESIETVQAEAMGGGR